MSGIPVKLGAFVTAFALFCFACSAPVGNDDERTILVTFDRTPTQTDIAAVESLGGANVRMSAFARLLWFRSEVPAAEYRGIDGVATVYDLGSDSNPEVSVFIDVESEPTQEDLDFVLNLGASTAGALSQRNRIAAVMPIGSVDGLATRERFTGVEVTGTTNFPT